jgi:hypothetical protein
MNDLETVKNRIRKLLALSKSNNENEAAAALEKANYLISEYKLDESALKFESVKIRSTMRLVPWRSLIANAVSWLYCAYLYRDNGVYVFTGEPMYVFMAGEMYSYLVKAVERIAGKSIRSNAKYLFRQSFKYGMADRIYDRIHILGQDCSWAPFRQSKSEEVKEYVENAVSMVTQNSKTRKVNKYAFNRGLTAANDVSLTRQAGYSR